MSQPQSMSSGEYIVWEGQPSLAVVATTFFVCLIFSWLIFPVFIALYEWLTVKTTHYRVTTERVTTTTGIFSKSVQQVELYRVRDIAVEYPFVLRLFKKGSVRLLSNDKTSPDLLVDGIDNADDMKEAIRSSVESLRQKKRRII